MDISKRQPWEASLKIPTDPNERIKMILQDIGSMITAYNMNHGECASIFLSFAADQCEKGGVSRNDFIQWAFDSWVDREKQAKNQPICSIIRVKNNGLFKGEQK